jgi:hypothetical protein
MSAPSSPKRAREPEPDDTASVGDAHGAGMLRVTLLREEVKKFGELHGAPMRLQKDFVAAFAAKVSADLQASLRRAKMNGRRTAMPQDV